METSMRIKALTFSLLQSFIIFYMVSCDRLPTPNEVTMITVPGEIITDPLVTPTQISSPTTTISPAATIRIIDSTSTPTFNHYANIPYEDRYIAVIDLLSSNGNCNLPCWWGIHPGEDFLQLADEVFSPLGYDFSQDNLSRDFTFPVNLSDISYNLRALISFKNNTVENIHILAESINIPGDKVSHFEEYAKAMKNYSLENILKQYGKPSRVFIRVYPMYEPNSPVLYSIWVFYDELGILINYEGEGVIKLDERAIICPEFEKLWSMDLYLQSPKNEDSLTEFADKTQYFEEQVAEESLLPLDRSASLTIDDFYRIFTSESQNKCFQYGLWP